MRFGTVQLGKKNTNTLSSISLCCEFLSSLSLDLSLSRCRLVATLLALPAGKVTRKFLCALKRAEGLSIQRTANKSTPGAPAPFSGADAKTARSTFDTGTAASSLTKIMVTAVQLVRCSPTCYVATIMYIFQICQRRQPSVSSCRCSTPGTYPTNVAVREYLRSEIQRADANAANSHCRIRIRTQLRGYFSSTTCSL